MDFKFGLWKRQSIIILIAALMVICLFFPMSVNAKEAKMRTLTVTGEGKEMIPTTLTQVQLGVEVQGQTSEEVQQEVANKSTSVVNLLKSRNVQQLKTTGISLQPNYDYNSSDRKLIGYIGTNLVSFSLETQQIGNLLDQVVKSGATRIDQVSFTATDDAIATAQKQALQAAVKNAQAQAEAVLSTLKLSSQEIVKIQVNGASVPQPMPQLEAAALAKDSNASTPVIGSEQTVMASVTLEVSY
ncbi:MAG: SIMPL domain-containing protein [Waterburya sp.]